MASEIIFLALEGKAASTRAISSASSVPVKRDLFRRRYNTALLMTANQEG